MSQSIDQIRSGKLNGAARISLREELSTFPSEIFQLADSLEILDLSDNNLTSLPDDFGQLAQLKILFLSNNNFKEVPRVLRTCPKLEMIAFKSNEITSFAEDALPITTKWLMLTNNRIEQLPHSFGELTQLRKLALAGNELTTLPASIEHCTSLELARFSANRLSAIPDGLLSLPKLSWLGVSGNDRFQRTEVSQFSTTCFPLKDLVLKQKIGEGASGEIHLAEWAPGANHATSYPDQVAVKLFKDSLTSDGYAADEIDCCISSGSHPNLIGILGHIEGSDQLGLVMDLIPIDYINLGHPPDFQSCTRDTFPESSSFDFSVIKKIGIQMASLLRQTHKNEVAHGDIYAHNIMVNRSYDLLFGDFGAATQLSNLDANKRAAFEKIEVRAFGCLLDDLLVRSKNSVRDDKLFSSLIDLKTKCLNLSHSLRPSFEEIESMLH